MNIPVFHTVEKEFGIARPTAALRKAKEGKEGHKLLTPQKLRVLDLEGKLTIEQRLKLIPKAIEPDGGFTEGCSDKLRAYSRILFGDPNDTAKIEYTDVVAFVNDRVESNSLKIDKKHLKSYDDRKLSKLVEVLPIVERLMGKKIVPPPKPPQKVGNTYSTVDVDEYLMSSRNWRFRTPMADALSKKPEEPASDSTRLKFAVGLDLTGCTHFGSGRMTASSVPEAARRIDTMQGNDFRRHIPLPGEIVVSDAAIPDREGLGCGSFPDLVSYVNFWSDPIRNRKGNDMVDPAALSAIPGLYDMSSARHPKRGGNRPTAGLMLQHIIASSYRQNPVQFLVKLTVGDVEKLTSPYLIVRKPRPHNLELIVAVNVDPKFLTCQTLDMNKVKRDIVDHNIRRNAACFSGKASKHLTYDAGTPLNPLLTHEPRTFEMQQFTFRTRYRPNLKKPLFLERSADKVRNLVKAGYFNASFNVNLHHIKLASRHDEIAMKMMALPGLREEEIATIMVITQLLESRQIRLTKAGKFADVLAQEAQRFSKEAFDKQENKRKERDLKNEQRRQERRQKARSRKKPEDGAPPQGENWTPRYKPQPKTKQGKG
jgi:hypothetical protein